MISGRGKALALLAGFLIGSLLEIDAQPIYTSIHDWTIKTPLGQIGYKEWQMIPSEFHYRCVVLGPFGRVDVNSRTIALGGGIAALLLAVGAIVFARRRNTTGQRFSR
jgi:hypothetical protein